MSRTVSRAELAVHNSRCWRKTRGTELQVQETEIAMGPLSSFAHFG